MVSGWVMFVASCVFSFRFLSFSFCHLYYMGRENCGLLVIYAYIKILTPFLSVVFVRMVVMAFTWMG